uniref:Putative transposase n=1 Tax=Candidatus Kentrum sp. TC TaxID=2126339 RepID=A0A450Z1Y2_9GAMM|nr:MAG: putative transposase [Candidatus Kentron sp. TC]VFK61133.1 MAG: putative transposase [Candidatus Kentron sp. TC]
MASSETALARINRRQATGTKHAAGNKRDIWVDGGYTGQLLEWIVARFKFSLAVVPRPKQTRKFVLLPRRWVVERTFSWLNNCPRLSKSYERLTRTDEA